LAHVIANPDASVFEKLESQTGKSLRSSAIGIMSLTPPEMSVIAADLAAKTASIELISMDVKSGTLFFAGSVSEVEAALKGVLDCLEKAMLFEVCSITRT
jgi:ethanolamine utilization protein EutS